VQSQSFDSHTIPTIYTSLESEERTITLFGIFMISTERPKSCQWHLGVLKSRYQSGNFLITFSCVLDSWTHQFQQRRVSHCKLIPLQLKMSKWQVSVGDRSGHSGKDKETFRRSPPQTNLIYHYFRIKSEISHMSRNLCNLGIYIFKCWWINLSIRNQNDADCNQFHKI